MGSSLVKCSVTLDSPTTNSRLLSGGVGFVCVHFVSTNEVMFFLFNFACPGSVLEFAVLYYAHLV